MSDATPHLLAIEGLSRPYIEALLGRTAVFFDATRQGHTKFDTLRGRTVMNLFFEASTRTRTSFEVAGKRLSADVINLNVAQSSVSKGETLLDTCRTLEAMRPDVLVMRHNMSGAADFVSRQVSCSVVNAGDGTHAHPTQALLDAFTVWRTLGTLSGLNVVICGDVAHSRVARSNAELFQLFGSKVGFVGPRTLLPKHAPEAFGVTLHDNFESAIKNADVIMLLRVQLERATGGSLPSLREYSATFGLGARQLQYAKPNALIMHPGPVNFGVELQPDVLQDKRSVILEQVEAGVAVRMAVLESIVKERSTA